MIMGVKNSDVRVSRKTTASKLAFRSFLSRNHETRRRRPTPGRTTGIVSVAGQGARRGPTSPTRFRAPQGIWVSEVVPSRFDAGTVYVTVDAHRLNDYDTHMWVSNDFGATFGSLNGNLKGEVVKTMTEDQRNPDVLYVGTETGLFLSIDRAKSWARLKANLPTVRVDEITLHPRDNAMIVATHGRAFWILDHLEPIQEYAAAQAAATDARALHPPPYAMFRRRRDPQLRVLGRPGRSSARTAGDGDHLVAQQETGQRREAEDQRRRRGARISARFRARPLANYNKAGIQSACWDLRVQPNPVSASGGRAGQAGQVGQEAGRAGGAGTVGRSPFDQAPGWRRPSLRPSARSVARDARSPTRRWRRIRRRREPERTAAVIGGVYTVSLIVDGKTIESKPLRVNEDPEVVLTAVERKRMYDQAMEIHALQPRVNEATTPMRRSSGSSPTRRPGMGRGRPDFTGRTVKASSGRSPKEVGRSGEVGGADRRPRSSGGGRGDGKPPSAKLAQGRTA